jgi:GT2 family glycosyltransferase
VSERPAGDKTARGDHPAPPCAVSAVIPNRDGADLLRRTLPPLLRELPPQTHEILVIDDASRDDSAEMLARDFPQVRVVRLPDNVGFGAACNRGFAEAQHELVLLLNSDMEVTPGSVAVLAEHMGAPDVFAAGPRYVAPGTEPGPRDDGRGIVRAMLGSPAGGGLFSRGKFLELGGFDALYYPFYWEDLDLGWNAWRRGWRIIRDARVDFIHLESATIGRLYPRGYIARMRARNRYLFGWKNFAGRALRRRHASVLLRRALVDLLRRGDAAALAAIPEAWRIARREGFLSPRSFEGRSDEEILRESETPVELLLGV